MDVNTKSLGINLLSLILLFIVINILGRFLWPFAAYATGWEVPSTCLIVSGVVGLIGLILLIFSYKKKISKKIAWWILATAIAIYSCTFLTINGKYCENARYIGDYIEINKNDKGPNVNGLATKFGNEFIEPRYTAIIKTFSKKESRCVYVAIESKDIDPKDIAPQVKDKNKDTKFYKFSLYVYNEKGNMINNINVDEGNCDFIDDYIEKNIGNILDTYTLKYKKNDNMFRMINDSYKEAIRKAEAEAKRKADAEAKRKAEAKRWITCLSCKGTGRCGWCGGSGAIFGGGCSACHMSGVCSKCHGRGKIRRR